jgi:hypothetical protein
MCDLSYPCLYSRPQIVPAHLACLSLKIMVCRSIGYGGFMYTGFESGIMSYHCLLVINSILVVAFIKIISWFILYYMEYRSNLRTLLITAIIFIPVAAIATVAFLNYKAIAVSNNY